MNRSKQKQPKAGEMITQEEPFKYKKKTIITINTLKNKRSYWTYLKKKMQSSCCGSAD